MHVWPTDGWSTAAPLAVGMDPEPLNRLIAEARAGHFRDLHSLLVVKNGRLIVEEYLPGGTVDQLHTLQSVSKSVTSTLVGVAVQQGHIQGTDTPLLSYFPQYGTESVSLQNLDDRKRAISLEDVLRMRLGLEWEEIRVPYDSNENDLYQLNHLDGDWYRFVLDKPMAETPGERFVYNSGGTILLAGVLDRATGMRTDEFARRHLFEPLGMDAPYWTVVNGVTHTGGGLSMTARDLAKFGYLHLRDGVWEGTRLLPEGWVRRATTGPTQAMAPGAMPIGFGYLWWLIPGHADQESATAEAAAYVAWGNMGQYVFVAPRYDLLFVVTGGAENFADETRPFDLFYEYVIPAADPEIAFVVPEVDVPSAQTAEAPADAPTPTTPTFERAFGGPNADRGIAVTATRDGGFVTTGTTRSFGNGGEDVYLVRTDADGVESFSATVGGADNDCGWSVHELEDGGLVVAGFTESFGAGKTDAYLIRMDASGDTLWTRTYGGPEDDFVWDCLPVDDGFILAGQTASSGEGDADFYLLKTDRQGDVQWERT
ncbi:MAG: serine hydrolase, partial [Gemmatimonadetes bacterium]|nr:serine hydrolase [Gemmatimonadota bacterium]